MKSAYVTRYGACGDHIHSTHVPRLLKEQLGYDYVAFEYNYKGIPIYDNNPFIDEHIFFEPSAKPVCDYPWSFIEKRWAQIMADGGFSKHINLYRSIENNYLAMEDMAEYYMSDKYRRDRYGKLNFYDAVTEFIGHPEFCGMKGELYFTETEESFINKMWADYELNDKFVIVCNLSGTSRHKLFYKAEAIIKQFLSRHSDAVCITMGDDMARQYADFRGERIINRAGNFAEDKHYPFRQSMLITKYAQLVIGCESGIMVAATLLGAPTVQLMTAASIKNHGGDFANDYSLQSPCKCSPCHKGPYQYVGCPKININGQMYPICIKFDSDTIISRMEEVYGARDQKSEQETGSAVPAMR